MGHMRFCRAVVGGASAVALGALGTGVAWAASVSSDGINIAGTVKHGPTPNSFTFNVPDCSLSSDGEPTREFACTMSGTLQKTTTGYNGTSKTTSPDATFTSTFSLTSRPGGPDTLRGKGTEVETESGKPQQNAATMTGAVSVQAPGTIFGRILVFESPSAP